MPYILGEDAKRIDWKSTAKTGKPQRKLYFQEREIHIAITLFMSGSMHFKEKKKDALHIATRLGFEAINHSHALTPIMISPQHTLLLPTSKKPHSIEYFLKKINKLHLQKAPLDMQHAFKQINTHLKTKSLLIMIGDFLQELDLAPLSKKHSLFLIIIRDPFEEHPYPLGEGDFSDLESTESASFYFGKKEAAHYRQKYKEHDAKLFAQLHKLAIPYQKITSSNLHIS